MNIKNLENKIIELDEPHYRLDQILKAIFQENIFYFNDINNIPKRLKEELKDELIINFKIIKIIKTKDLNTYKILIELNDKNIIESVLIKNKNGYTACISSQCGCPLNCAFCATGQNGFIRNLTSEEITDQILFWKKYILENNIQRKLTNIVYMGMGEPFLNYKNIVESIENLTNKNIFNSPDRSISISTSFANPEKMKNFFSKFPQINLAISLHFANNEKRSKYMPINNKYNLDDIKDFINYYLEKYNKKIFLEYIMIKNINDSKNDADNLIHFVKSIEKNYLIHINIIKYNNTYKNFNSSNYNNIIKFENYLKHNKINITLRKSFGTEITAACGQLAGKINNNIK